MKTLLKFAAALALLSTSAFAGDLVNISGASKIALSGYDPVAFFTDAKPVNGSPSITAEYQGATYLFASEEHKKLFAEKSDKYAPQFGGFCAFGVAVDKLFPVDINTWQVRDGKLYLNLNAEILKGFNAGFDANLAKASKNWPGLVKRNEKPAPVARATTPNLVNVSGASKIAVGGYDAVAFFIDSKAIPGSPSISAEYQGATYLFASEEHKKLFTDNSDKYAPQFGGYCAFGVAVDKLFPVDISTWQVRDGKLYLNLNADVLKGFNAEFEARLAKANRNWPSLVKQYGS